MFELKYFMWPWQHQFQPCAADIAQRLLKLIEPQLKPDVFIVGFRTEEDAEGQEPICVSPEDCRFRPELFRPILPLTNQPAFNDPRSRISPYDGIQRAIDTLLAEQDPDCVFFASKPTDVNGYAVLVIVQLDRVQFDSHYRLTRGFVQKAHRPYSVGRSLVDTTVECFLDSLVEKLQQPEPGRDIRLIRDYSSVYRAAAERLMRAPAWAGGDLMGLGDIYDVCNAISLQNYEGAEGAGRLAFARGARYNSGVRYAYHEAKRVVIVKSEDGMVNVLPERA